MVEILVLKFITLVLLFITSSIFGALPYFLRKLGKNKKFTGAITTFLNYSQGLASGVLLGGGLLHLIPDATEGFNDSLTDMGAPDWLVAFPFATFLSILSFITILFFEVSVTILFSKPHHSHDHAKTGKYKKEEIEPLTNNTGDMSINDEDEPHSHSHFDVGSAFEGKPIATKIIGAVFLWFSLSLHSIFAGLALGSTTEMDSFTILLVAIVAHKLIAAYSLGIELEQGFKNPCAFITMVYLFSISTPTGIVIGALCTMIASHSAFVLVSSTLLAVSSGAFLHVSLYEFLFDFTVHNKLCSGFVIFIILFFSGFFLMALLTFWT